MNRLLGFWRQRSKRGKALLAAVVVGAVTAVVAVVGAVSSRDVDANVSSETTATSATTDMTTASAPIRCLDAAGLSDVEQRDADLWRGFHDSPVYAIIVRKLATPVRTPKVVAGTYVVTGRFKVAAEAADLTSEEGLEVDVLVQVVVDCVGG